MVARATIATNPLNIGEVVAAEGVESGKGEAPNQSALTNRSERQDEDQHAANATNASSAGEPTASDDQTDASDNDRCQT